MSVADNLDVLMFLVAILVLLSGYPVAFSLAGVALAFAFLGAWLNVFDLSILAATPNRIYGTMTNPVLVAVPLFVFMGVMLEKSKVAEALLETLGALFGSIRGGLGVSVIVVGALLAASTGIVGATVVTMGLLALPTMLKRGYDPGLASGAIAASGTLGQIIPPSIVLVLLGDVMTNAYQRAQLAAGNFSPKTVSIGDLFAGALLPGLVLVVLYIAFVLGFARWRPEVAPATPPEERSGVGLIAIVHALVPPLALMVAVLGSILTGVATATEAAAVGALGATLIAGFRHGGDAGAARLTQLAVLSGAIALAALFALRSLVDLRLGRETMTSGETIGVAVALILCAITAAGVLAAIRRLWSGGYVQSVCTQTGRITAMVFVILIGATIFSLVFRGLGGDELVERILNSASGGLTNLAASVVGALGFSETAAGLTANADFQAAAGVLIVMAVMFVLGFFLDFIEITFVVVPLVAPPLLALGVDPVWLGVMMALNLQTSFLTPPFGFALFYLRGVAPASVKTLQIYRGAMPFIGIQLATLIAVALFPALATGLPALIGQ